MNELSWKDDNVDVRVKILREGPLSDFITTNDLYDTRLSNKSNVVNLIQDGNWYWPTKWNTKFPRLYQIPLPDL
ncbi:hypothetical protein Tco_0707565 [Tanacetum coccineum]|uniref:Uncharacterized protein n=1 Tax=Tanacetum coccineum TaxID=301880 RepID=A0ABQ4YAM3_9ASTR